MKLTISLVILAILALTMLQSCKKDTTPIPEDNTYQPTIAPCEIPETIYDLDSVFYGPSVNFPEAKYRIKFYDTTAVFDTIDIEFAFNKVPTSGMYYMVSQIDTNSQVFPNQIAFTRDYGGFKFNSVLTGYAEVYIEVNENEIIISYCNISCSDVQFDTATLSYNGNSPANYKVRKQY